MKGLLSNPWSIGVIVTIIGGLILYFVFGIGKSPKISAKEIEKLTPKFKTSVRFEPAGSFNHNRYHFEIQNTNKDSVNIVNLRIKIVFNNTIKDILPNIILPNNEDFSAAVLENVGTTINGEEVSYRMDTNELLNNYGCSVTIQKVIINGDSVNTNTAVLFCREWPLGSLITVYITVDEKTNIQVIENIKEGTFQGTYEYLIGVNKFIGKIEGKIK